MSRRGFGARKRPFHEPGAYIKLEDSMAIPDDRRSLLAAMQTNYLHLTHQLKSVPAERARSACVAGHVQ